jgi:hypothetical protein
MENSMEIPQKAKNRTAISSTDTSPGLIQRNMSQDLKKRHTLMFIATIHNSQVMETTHIRRPTTDE